MKCHIGRRWTPMMLIIKAYDKRLTGANLYTNTDQVIAMATFSSGVQEDYKDITLTLNYEKDYDPTKKYRFAIVFSSSKMVINLVEHLGVL